MKGIIFRALTATLAVVASLATVGFAQNTPSTSPAASAGTRVAVIDIAKVFENHPGFKQAMEGMKNDVQVVENNMRQLRQQIEAIRERMKQYQPGSPEFKKFEDDILKIQADGQIEGTKQKKNFIEREAGVYYSTYREIEAEVESFARQHGIGLVLRYNSTAMDPKNPQSVLEGVNSPIVYQDRINITSAISDQLARRYAANPAARAAAPR